MRLGERPPEHGKILGVGIGQAAVDAAVARDHSVAQKLLLVQAKQGATVGHQGPQLLKRTFVEEQLEALACRQLLFGVLGVDAGLAAAELGFSALGGKRFKCVTAVH